MIISFAEQAIIVPADIAKWGTITLISLLNLLLKYVTIDSAATGDPPGVCNIRSRPILQSNPFTAFINPSMSESLMSKLGAPSFVNQEE